MCAFQVVVLRRPAEIAHRAFVNIRPPFLPFRDATTGVCTYQCTVLDCVKGLEYAMRVCNWFRFEDFNCEVYDYYERVENGDMNWVMLDNVIPEPL